MKFLDPIPSSLNEKAVENGGKLTLNVVMREESQKLSMYSLNLFSSKILIIYF